MAQPPPKNPPFSNWEVINPDSCDKTGLCVCCDSCEGCCCSTFFPCVLYGQSQAALSAKDECECLGSDANKCMFWGALYAVTYYFTAAIPTIMTAVQTCNIENRKRNDQNGCQICCEACWCQGCVLWRNKVEAEAMAEQAGPGIVVKSGYQALMPPEIEFHMRVD